MVRIRGRLKKEKKVEAGLLEVFKGFGILQKVDEIDAEHLRYKDEQGEQEEPYVGVDPGILEIRPSILPLPRIQKALWARKRWRIRLHFKRFGERFTRDFYTGGILDKGKKTTVLIEKGVIDQEGFLLDKKGNRMVITEEEDDGKIKEIFFKVDVSDIDFIKAETKAYAESKTIEKTAIAMSKTGLKFDRNFYMLIGAFGIMMVAIVFIMSGGLGSVGL